MTIDTDSLSFDFFDIAKASDCDVCSDPVMYKPSGTNEVRVTQLCSQSFNISPEKMMSLDLEEMADEAENSDFGSMSDAAIKYNCRPAVLGGDKFTPPSSVNFVDLDAMMGGEMTEEQMKAIEDMAEDYQ